MRHFSFANRDRDIYGSNTKTNNDEMSNRMTVLLFIPCKSLESWKGGETDLTSWWGKYLELIGKWIHFPQGQGGLQHDRFLYLIPGLPHFNYDIVPAEPIDDEASCRQTVPSPRSLNGRATTTIPQCDINRRVVRRICKELGRPILTTPAATWYRESDRWQEAN